MANRKAADGAGTIRKKTVTKNGQTYTYWEARITTGRDPGTGKQLQRSFSGKTQKEVREKLQAASVAISDGEYIAPSKMTVGGWLDIWTRDYLLSQKYATIKHYKAQVNTHIKPALGAIKLSALAPHDIQRFYNALLKNGRTIETKGKNGKPQKQTVPLSAKSVRNIHGVLTKSLSQAVANGYIKSNPASVVSLPRVERKEIAPLTEAQVKAYVAEAAADEYGDMLKVILFTGLRESEALGLTWDCVDFKAGTLTICKQLQKRPEKDGGFVFAPLKNNKTRVLSPAPFVMDILRGVKQQQAEARLQARELWQGWQNDKERQSWYAFTNGFGQHLHPQTVYSHHKKVAARADAPNARVHDLRHTYAVLSLQNGDDVKTVQDALGHATAAFTLDVYGHVSEKMKADSAARMQAYYDAIKEA